MNNEQHLTKLKYGSIQRGHPEELLEQMTKIFSPSFKSQNEQTDYIDFVQTYNPNTKFNKSIIDMNLNDFHGNSIKNAFQNKMPLLATSHTKLSQDLFIKAQFDLVPKSVASPKK